jgi:hypothetical protein
VSHDGVEPRQQWAAWIVLPSPFERPSERGVRRVARGVCIPQDRECNAVQIVGVGPVGALDGGVSCLAFDHDYLYAPGGAILADLVLQAHFARHHAHFRKRAGPLDLALTIGPSWRA